MKVEINTDTTYYAITRKKEKTYIVKFYKNNAQQPDSSTDLYIEKSCTIDALARITSN